MPVGWMHQWKERMLIGFRFQNFRSFLAEQSFSFSTSSDRTHESTHLIETGMKAVPRISKAGIVFGPNASGKTNLLIALATFRDLILHSNGYSDSQFSEKHTPYRFGPSMSQATEFEIDVLLDQVRYRYAISYDSQRIRSERLLVYRTGKSQRWFERRFDENANRESWAPFSPNFNGPREMWRKATRPQALFLTTAAQLNSEQLSPLLTWFEHRLEILFPGDISDVNRIARRMQDEAFKNRVLELLNAVDIHVDDVRVAEQDQPRAEDPPPGAAFPRQGAASRSIEFLHARDGLVPMWLDSMFEAAGTQRLIALFGPLLQAVENGRLLLIDEFDASLHPLVARFLIRLINDPRVSCKGAQILLTSHNATLMDLELLRRDEIWLVQLDDKHASNLMPLLRSSPRKHELIAKNYLKGRYGAVPLIRSHG
jgi:AAA15 family ATPase/GTPase